MAALRPRAVVPLAQVSERLKGITSFLEERQQPKFRAKQLCDAIYKKRIQSVSEAVCLPLSLRKELEEEMGTSRMLSLKPVESQRSKQANKVLFEVPGSAERVEAVMMKFEQHNSVCISSQAGCALACSFCATGAVGFKRNLTADQIVDQVLHFMHEGEEIHSVSFMGMGEPLMNPNLFKALRILTDRDGLDMSPRRLNVSTVGIIPGIRKLSNMFPQVNLAFSLHSPFEEQRSRLMPVNKTNPLPHVFQALDEHAEATKRKIFIAYLLLEGENDSDEHAKEVVKLLVHERPKHLRHLYHVNLLRYNPMGLTNLEIEQFSRTGKDTVERFKQVLLQGGVRHLTLRQSFGLDIDAACGQLFAKYEAKKVRNST